jgi:DNA-binding beta-propeller fold protein YncE
MNARKLILAALCTLLGALVLSTGSASALTVSPEVAKLTGFGEPAGMAVDSAGNLYVTDAANHVVDRFDSSNAPLNFSASKPYVEGAKLTGTLGGPFERPQGVAVNNATGDIYVTDGGEHNVVDVFNATGEYLSQITGTPVSAPVSGPFADPYGVAVDQADGNVYVTDAHSGVVDVFNAANEYVLQFGKGVLSGTYAESVAINELTGTTYVSDSGSDSILLFNSTGTPIEPAWHGAQSPAGSFGGGYVGVGIDPSNEHVYVSATQGFVDEFKPSTSEEYLSQIGSAEKPLYGPRTVAVSPLNGRVYTTEQNASVSVFGASIVLPDVALTAASERKAHSAVLNGTVDPDEAGAVTCLFEYGTSTAYGHSVPCSKAVPSGNSPVAVSAEVSGLEPDTTYHFRLKATNTNGPNTSQDGEFRSGGPGILLVSSVGISAEAATIAAQIDPNGSIVHYYFQYGTSTSYGTDLPAPPGREIAGGSVTNVSIHLQGLQLSTTYHYRLVMEGELSPGEVETFTGADQTFTTQSRDTNVSVPDGRQFELVTPPNKLGAGIIAQGNEQGADTQASINGSGITYTTTSPIEVNPAGSRSLETTQVISTRIAPGDWETKDIATAHDRGAIGYLAGNSSEYRLFSSDLSYGLVEPVGDTPLGGLGPEAERTMYVREADGQYKALVTSANVPAGVKFGGHVSFVAASPDFSHIVVSSTAPLTSPPHEGQALYEWVGGRFAPVSVLPNHQIVEGSVGKQGGSEGGNVRHAISNDGSHIVWEHSFPGQEAHDYIRDMTSGETVETDAAQGAPAPEHSYSTYMTANAEGTRVFFTSPERLTADSTAAEAYSQIGDLYEFEVTSGANEPLAGKLTDLTVDPHPGATAGVINVVAESKNGSYVYFVAEGKLGNATKTGDNLYVEHLDEATKTWSAPTLIAALSQEDLPDWEEYGGHGSGGLTSNASPNGRYLAFMSNSSLTEYDNVDADSGAHDEEVYLYNSSTNRLLCASCNPTGARPVGLAEGNEYEENLVDYAKNWQYRTMAANVPGLTTKSLSSSIYQARYIDDSGRLFFNSNDALVPADVNGKEDVYEYEPSGVGSCQPPGYGESGSVVYSSTVEGCIALISTGTSSEESAFMDASESGGDVFFLTLSRLVPADYDTSIDLYDSHECTSSSPCAPAPALTPPPCTTGDACKPGPTPQPTLYGEPSSQTFSGAGNVTPGSTAAKTVKPKTAVQPRAQKLAKALRVCARGPKAKRKRCQAQARKKYGPVRTAKKTDRRAK